jgi:hypothetical protein
VTTEAARLERNAKRRQQIRTRSDKDRARDKRRLLSLRLKPGETRDCYGFYTIRTMREVAAILGVSYQAVYYLERTAFIKIRQAFAAMQAEGKL